MSAEPASFSEPGHKDQVEASKAPPLTLSGKSAGRNPMDRAHIIRSNTFRWALAVAGVFAVFVVVLFGFIYWQTDQDLIAGSDKMIASQLNFIAGLPGERQQNAINDHLKQDSRGVQYAGLFGADGRKIAGNLERFPPDLQANDSVQGISVERAPPAARQTHVIRAIARRMPNGDALVIGREVDETREISHVVAQALALGLLPAFSLCLLAGVWLSVRAQKRVEEVNQRVQRIVAGELRERLPEGNTDDSFARLAGIVNGMLDEMETMINALA